MMNFDQLFFDMDGLFYAMLGETQLYGIKLIICFLCFYY